MAGEVGLSSGGWNRPGPGALHALEGADLSPAELGEHVSVPIPRAAPRREPPTNPPKRLQVEHSWQEARAGLPAPLHRHRYGA